MITEHTKAQHVYYMGYTVFLLFAALPIHCNGHVLNSFHFIDVTWASCRSTPTANSTIYLRKQWRCALLAHCEEKPHVDDGFPLHTARSTEAVYITMSTCQNEQTMPQFTERSLTGGLMNISPRAECTCACAGYILNQWEKNLITYHFYTMEEERWQLLVCDVTCKTLSLHPVAPLLTWIKFNLSKDK